MKIRTSWTVNKAFPAGLLHFLLIVNTVRVKAQLEVLTKNKCLLLQADCR